MTGAEMIEKAAALEQEADNLYMSLLAPSMRERTLREEAQQLRERAVSQDAPAAPDLAAEVADALTPRSLRDAS